MSLTRMTLRHFLGRGAMAAGAAALAVGAALRLARAATPMTMQAAWINDAEFMGYIIGLDEGYYAAEGLDLDIPLRRTRTSSPKAPSSRVAPTSR
jgi:ABC-type nitrate/sulfonate/bicarbonate transport system substrate-binding protein